MLLLLLLLMLLMLLLMHAQQCAKHAPTLCASIIPLRRRFNPARQPMNTQHTEGKWRLATSYDHVSTASSDARLIAAAPDMLALLERLVLLCPSDEGLGGHAPIQAFISLGREASKLITKVTT